MHSTSHSHSLSAVVIEDDPEIRALHKQVLEPLGFDVVLTSNAGDGIAAVREFDPTLTFLDVNMAGMDGFAAAGRIRSFSSTYIIMITALDDEIDVVQGLNAGADDYVVKPFRPRELRARVEAMLRRPRVAAVVEPEPEPEPAPEPEPDLTLWRPGAPSVVATPAPPAAPVAPATPAPTNTVPAPRAAQRSAPSPAQTPAPRTAPTVTRTRAIDAPVALAAPAEEPEEHRTEAVEAVEFTDEQLRSHRDLHLHMPSGIVTAFDQQIQLAPAEAGLLAALMDSGGRVRSTANLVLSLRGESYVTTYYVNEGDKRAVLDHMESLRRKLGDAGASPIWIEPVRGVGFRMTPG